MKKCKYYVEYHLGSIPRMRVLEDDPKLSHAQLTGGKIITEAQKQHYENMFGDCFEEVSNPFEK